MDFKDEAVKAARIRSRRALDELTLAPAAILESMPDPVVASGRDTRIVFVNRLAEQLFGYERDELIGQPVQTLWPERVRERYTRNMQLYFATDHPLRFSTEVWGVRKDGSEFVGEMSWGIVETTAGSLLLATGRDITERRNTEARLRAVATMGERALQASDPATLAADAIDLLCSTLPIVAAEIRLLGGPVLSSHGTLDDSTIRIALGTEHGLRVVAGREMTDDELSLLRAIAEILATALARLGEEQQARYEAVHDPLTGLANRTLLRDRLTQALARSGREGGATGLLFIDLDDFKDINDQHGHAIGDTVLAELGARIQAAVRPADTVARFGGDEFVVICEQIDEAIVMTLGQRLQEAIQEPLEINGVIHTTSASIGIAIGQDDADTLLGNADVAVYRAKAAGRATVRLFE